MPPPLRTVQSPIEKPPELGRLRLGKMRRPHNCHLQNPQLPLCQASAKPHSHWLRPSATARALALYRYSCSPAGVAGSYCTTSCQRTLTLPSHPFTCYLVGVKYGARGRVRTSIIYVPNLSTPTHLLLWPHFLI